MNKAYYIGIMSGTSVDAIDVAIVDFNSGIQLVAKHSQNIPPNIKKDILALCLPGENEINRMGELDNALAIQFANAVLTALEKNNLNSSQIAAIGSHGQTIRHMPDVAYPFTMQISNPALITELTDITTIADFRRADMAAGGQGAPLAPAFHAAIFTENQTNPVVLNLGGQANISILNNTGQHSVTGFDTGPGNALLNEWISLHKNKEYDEDGKWSASAEINEDLLNTMLSDDYFAEAPPKSTGREHFNLDWLNKQLDGLSSTVEANVVQSTLCELTARTVADAIKNYAPDCKEVLVCGGGVHNKDLMMRLQRLSGLKTRSTADYGVDPDFMEAMAFAWLAKQAMQGVPANAIEVTGAKHPVILGAIYPRSPKGT